MLCDSASLSIFFSIVSSAVPRCTAWLTDFSIAVHTELCMPFLANLLAYLSNAVNLSPITSSIRTFFLSLKYSVDQALHFPIEWEHDFETVRKVVIIFFFLPFQQMFGRLVSINRGGGSRHRGTAASGSFHNFLTRDMSFFAALSVPSISELELRNNVNHEELVPGCFRRSPRLCYNCE